VLIVVNLRQDPFERYSFELDFYRRWQAEKLWTLMPAQAVAARSSSKRAPPPLSLSGYAQLSYAMVESTCRF
jgi:arylsulfatase